MKHAGAVLAMLAVLPLGLSFVHPFGNPRIVPRKGRDTLLQQSTLAPEARSVLIAKCADCHSNETRWPAYARIALGSWLIERDIVEARHKMNLSNWTEMPADAQEAMMEEIVHKAKSGDMPPVQYRLLHWHSQLTSQDIASLSMMRKDGLAETTASGKGDAARGRTVFERRCTGCHAMEADREGPRLSGVFGRRAGSVPGYNYSTGLKNSGIIWKEDTLERWLTDPDAMVPENKMDIHLPKAQERSDIIAYFRR